MEEASCIKPSGELKKPRRGYQLLFTACSITPGSRAACLELKGEGPWQTS